MDVKRCLDAVTPVQVDTSLWVSVDARFCSSALDHGVFSECTRGAVQVVWMPEKSLADTPVAWNNAAVRCENIYLSVSLAHKLKRRCGCSNSGRISEATCRLFAELGCWKIHVDEHAIHIV